MKIKNKFILGVLGLALVAAIALWAHKRTSLRLSRSSNSDNQIESLASVPENVQPAVQQPRSGPPTPILPQPAGASNDLSRPKRFDQMDVFGRRAIKSEIGKQELPAIFKAMLDAERVEHDDLKQMHLQTTFANALRVKKPSPEFLEQMYGFLVNRANLEFERHLLIGALEEASTKESVDLLLRVAKTAPDQEMRGAAATLSGVASSSMNPPELSPMLERTWQETSNPTLIRSTATAMAKIGTPSGIELLLSAALATDKRDEARQQAAYYALQQTYRHDAVPPLAARLANQPPDSEAVKLVAPVLARIGDATAGKALVDWLQGRSENAAPLIDDLIRQRWLTNPFEAGWAAALDPALPFKNEENRKAIREALNAYRAGRTSR